MQGIRDVHRRGRLLILLDAICMPYWKVTGKL